ncbi:Flavonol synthase/flavanone 3-hydroxylase [Acorus gramineus]|uniref:Flavonol synthase/flavanone 3-hydroxylase n=1 Tax=Acorus gramineus TaxID=55184 RepID=A0AAV9BKR2_ACOGR|nr:Flavonol synthase/flavanone 3-hydroxylase [Acorus gramineus]
MACEVDTAFIQAPEHRPKPQISDAGGIPTIDLSPLNNHPISPDLVAEVGAACREWGFFQVINHGVPVELRRDVEAAAREFFGQSAEEKGKVRRDEANPLGYYDTENTKNVRDWKEVFDFIVKDVVVIPAEAGSDEVQEIRNRWPEYPPGMSDACKAYARGVEKLAFKLLELIALSLGLAGDRLNGFFSNQTSFLRLNHYPPCPTPHLALGVGRHKDAGGLTVLAQDHVGGLDVKKKSDGEWYRVKPIPDSYIINVGDLVQVWSNERYESAEHRVSVNSKRERFSIPFFFNPAHYTIVAPLEEMTNEENPPKYKPFDWGDFFKTRKNSNFKKLDVENLQIHHFKISE